MVAPRHTGAMPTIHKTKTVPYTPEQMFSLVNQVRDYPNFIPWCQQATVHSEHANEITATLTLAHGAIKKSFTTCNVTVPPHRLEMKLVKGPFKSLHGDWRFNELPNGHCEIVFDLQFEFANRLLALAFGPIFNQVANRLVKVFCDEADKRYGSAAY